MISVSTALTRIQDQINPLESEETLLHGALHRVLAEDVFSTIDMPPFPQSAMDGYAVHLHHDLSYEVLGEIKAGDEAGIVLAPGQAVRIFTGAMVPESANCVIRQEVTKRVNHTITVNASPSEGENIRPRGEQIKRGERIFEKGTKLNPGTIGHLATLGFEKVRVCRQPKIALIATGNELQQAGTRLEPGKIYESNTIMLRSALQQLGLDCSIQLVKDDYFATRDAIAHCLDSVDLLLLSGGISVGDYDFVERALIELEVECHFYKIKQKPGKPLFFGSRLGVFVFALPGNPAAALTCFYVYVRRALEFLQQISKDSTQVSRLPLAQAYTKNIGLTHILKGRIHEGKVHMLPAQSSAMLSSFSEANCLVLADENRENWLAGELIEFITLPL